MFPRLRALVIKELQALLRDPQSRRVLILPVILQTALFPFAATLEVKNNTLALFNRDNGAASIELVQRLAAAEAFTEILNLHTEAELEESIQNQHALIAIQIPPDFSRDLAHGTPADLQVILDGRRSNSAQIANGYVQQIINTFVDDHLTPAATQNQPPEISQVTRHWFNPNLHYYWFIVPSLVAIITTITTLIVTALSVAREREQGTFDQLLVSPLTPAIIMIGKGIPAGIVSIAQATIILLVGVFLYRIPFEGSLPLLYFSMIFYIAALVGFGLLISSICSTQQQALLGVFCFLMPAILLSGFTSPIDNMPAFLQIITWANPLRFFIVIVKGLFLKDMPFTDVLHNLWPLLVIATVTLLAANVVFRRKIG